MKLRTALATGLLVFALAACGGSDPDTDQIIADAQDSIDEALENADDLTESALDEAEGALDDALDAAEEAGVDTSAAEDLADDVASSLQDVQDAAGGGGATLTVGDMTYEFESLLCAFGPEQIGQEGAELVVSSLQDGTQFYVSIDSFGHNVSLNDIEDFENPSVSLTSEFGAGEFIELDGKDFSGSVDFIDDTTDSLEPVPGSFSGTCP